MSRILRNICLLILTLIGVQCGSKEKVQTGVANLPPEFNDPYLQSFRNKNIRYAISERLSLTRDPYPDTIDFDQRGNIVRIRRYGGEEKRAYDSNDFLVRRWERSDVTMQYIARYSVHGDTLIQSWRELNSHDWELRGDTTSEPHEVNYFVFDQNGRVIQEFNDGFGPMNYVYSDGKLVRKEIEMRQNNDDNFHLERTTEVTYDSNGEIQKLKLSQLNSRDPERLFYFSKGLLDSCTVTSVREEGSRRVRYRYRYIYIIDPDDNLLSMSKSIKMAK